MFRTVPQWQDVMATQEMMGDDGEEDETDDDGHEQCVPAEQETNNDTTMDLK